ncbi:MAG: mannose-1-phosphate guanylyltransferase [Bacteroidales bacterium]|nr:mannose-1-phosphate guanylyltransferase [Bacteroidales bacterium]
MTHNNNHLVIMAGGKGSRFWPMSTTDYPKQFLDILGCGRTLLQLTMDRFQGICPMENVWVVTSGSYAGIVRQQLPEVQEDHILSEPCRRNTAPCIAYVSWKIKKKCPKANLVVTPSDHLVLNTTEFQRLIGSALSYTDESDAIVTLGLRPNRPETGYGYIEADTTRPSVSNKEIFRVDAFKEKPDLATARKYIEKDYYYWNSGIFVWNVNTIVNSIRVYAPNIANVFERLLPFFFTEREQEMVDKEFPLCENISIDYAVMEKAEEIFVMPASIGWSDLGTWSSLQSNMDKDHDGNVTIGENIQMFESRNCMVHTTEERKVVIQGLDGYIVAEKNNTLLICRIAEEQRIRDFAE